MAFCSFHLCKRFLQMLERECFQWNAEYVSHSPPSVVDTEWIRHCQLSDLPFCPQSHFLYVLLGETRNRGLTDMNPHVTICYMFAAPCLIVYVF